jgi:hypothetical protein
MKKLKTTVLITALVLSGSQAFACSGLGATILGNCDLDRQWDDLKQAVPIVNAIDQAATQVGRAAPIVVGGAIAGPYGAFAGRMVQGVDLGRMGFAPGGPPAYPTHTQVGYIPGPSLGGHCFAYGIAHPMSRQGPLGAGCGGYDAYGRDIGHIVP